ncbi:hypothetical protein EJB05_47384, partial [Eragrostis curvula]
MLPPWNKEKGSATAMMNTSPTETGARALWGGGAGGTQGQVCTQTMAGVLTQLWPFLTHVVSSVASVEDRHPSLPCSRKRRSDNNHDTENICNNADPLEDNEEDHTEIRRNNWSWRSMMKSSSVVVLILMTMVWTLAYFDQASSHGIMAEETTSLASYVSNERTNFAKVQNLGRKLIASATSTDSSSVFSDSDHTMSAKEYRNFMSQFGRHPWLLYEVPRLLPSEDGIMDRSSCTKFCHEASNVHAQKQQNRI